MTLKCNHCGSTKVEVEIDEDFDGVDETIHVYLLCNQCNLHSHFPDHLDWRDYIGYRGE